MVAVIALWTVQLLVASALLAKVLATLEKEKEIPFLVHDRKTTCEQWDDKDYKFKCTHIIGGVVSFTLRQFSTKAALPARAERPIFIA